MNGFALLVSFLFFDDEAGAATKAEDVAAEEDVAAAAEDVTTSEDVTAAAAEGFTTTAAEGFTAAAAEGFAATAPVRGGGFEPANCSRTNGRFREQKSMFETYYL